MKDKEEDVDATAMAPLLPVIKCINPTLSNGNERTSGSGSGNLRLSTTGSTARFSSLSATYPLKLLSPTPLPSQPPNVGLVYTLAYGGGLVAGDVISLEIHIENGGGLVMLTQGSTKIFKLRLGLRPLSTHPRLPIHHADNGATAHVNSDGLVEVRASRQRLHVTLESGAFLMLMPDSISPFKDSNYAQVQGFVLPEDGTASVLILDWVNSGRRHSNQLHSNDDMHDSKQEAEEVAEIWSMERYLSINEVFVGDNLVMREKMLLDNSHFTSDGQAPTQRESVTARLAPYHVYATVLIYGPQFKPLFDSLNLLVDQTSQFKISTPPNLLWSFSETTKGIGGVLRVAGVEVEQVRIWLRSVFEKGGLKNMVGDGVWPRVI